MGITAVAVNHGTYTTELHKVSYSVTVQNHNMKITITY
jgi:hypothetical protein